MTLRIGFVGVGGIAQVHLENVHQSGMAAVVAVCDVVEEAAQKAAVKYGASAYTQVDAMLEGEQLDALFLCVPPFAHGDVEEKAAARGIHLFVEKPLGLNLASVQRKAAAIRDAGVICGSGYCLRYQDIVQEAKAYLQDKTIAMLNGYYLTSFVQTPWWRKMAKSGGQLVEQTTHTVDMMRYLAGDVMAVHAWMKLNVSQDIEGLDIYDVGTVNLAFASGAIGHVGTTFIQPDHRSGVEVYGRDFRVHIDGGTLTITEQDQAVTKKSRNHFYKDQDIAFLDAIRTGDRSKVLAPYDEALRTLAVTLAANDSAATGQVVNLS